MADSPANKTNIKTTQRGGFVALRQSVGVNAILALLIPLITTFTLEWIARGSFADNAQNTGFFQALRGHFPSFALSYLLLVFVYVFITYATGLHAVATFVVGLLGNVPAVVTYYKLTMRGEPFLPWDLSQINDLLGVKDNVNFGIQPNMVITLGIFVALVVLACFVRIPPRLRGKSGIKYRLIPCLVSVVCAFALFFGIFLNPLGTAMAGIKEDMWMQDRYYRTNGVLTGFLTNLQMLNIDRPAGYSEEAVLALEKQIEEGKAGNYTADSVYTPAADAAEQQPDIIFLMAESFWDVTSLQGIEYDQPLLQNLDALSAEGARGMAYTPSFGGGTCDVEFEALTGFSMDHLPAGSKPYQQYVTGQTFSLPNYLKYQGYETLAIHGYGRRFWNRDQAYPRLGIDTFIAQDDFVNPDMKRGFISDDAMVDKIIEQHKERVATGTPVFIHAVTMQNHTNYSPDKYPKEQLVNIIKAPSGLPDSTVGQLEDCATGIRDMDRALGKLATYLRTCGRPTLLVFWGDHLNPMSDGYTMFEATGFIEPGDTASPALRQTPLLMWSNYTTAKVQLGTLATYNLSPVLMQLYGLDKPLMFEFLAQQLPIMRGRTRGVTIGPNGSFDQEMTEQQQTAFNNHAILQYDYLFGHNLLESYTTKP